MDLPAGVCYKRKATHPGLPFFAYLFLAATRGNLHTGVTITAVYRSPISGFERYLCVFPTCCTNSSIHFPLPLIAVAIPTTIWTTGLLLFGYSAFRTTLGIVGETFASEELLLWSCKAKLCAAVHTVEDFLFVIHGWSPFIKTQLQSRHPWPGQFVRTYADRGLQTFNR